jgi:hypothetical protein
MRWWLVICLVSCGDAKPETSTVRITVGDWRSVPFTATVSGKTATVRDASFKSCAECPAWGEPSIEYAGKRTTDIAIAYPGPCGSIDIPFEWDKDDKHLVKLAGKTPEPRVSIFVDNRGGSATTILVGKQPVAIAANATTQVTAHGWTCGELPVARDGTVLGTIAPPENTTYGRGLLIDVSGKHCYAIAPHEYGEFGLRSPTGTWTIRDKHVHHAPYIAFPFEPAPPSYALSGTHYSLADC